MPVRSISNRPNVFCAQSEKREWDEQFISHILGTSLYFDNDLLKDCVGIIDAEECKIFVELSVCVHCFLTNVRIW